LVLDEFFLFFTLYQFDVSKIYLVTPGDKPIVIGGHDC